MQQIFHWYVDDHVAFRAIVRRLNDQGIPSPAVNKFNYPDPTRRPRWGRTQLLRILREPTYKGDAIGWRYAQGGRLRPDTEWIRLPTGTAPAIIPAALWEAAATRLGVNRGQDTRNQARPYLLRRHIVCAVCHQTLYSEVGRGIRTTGVPHATKSVGPVVARASRQMASKPGCGPRSAPSCTIRHCGGRAATAPGGGSRPIRLADRDMLQRRLNIFERQQQRLIHHFREDERAPWALIRREFAQIEQDRRQVEAGLVAIEKRLAEQQMMVTPLEALETYCAQYPDNVNDLISTEAAGA